MAYLKINLTAEFPLPKGATASAQLSIKAGLALQLALAELMKLDDKGNAVFSTDIAAHDDAEPAPAPKKRGRKPRAALGSSPLNVELRDPVAESAQTTAVAHGAPGDDLDIPGFLRREAKP